MPLAILVALGVGAVFGLINGYFVAVLGLSSLAVTLAGYIGFRGLARLLVEDRSVGGFPTGSPTSGSRDLIGPVTLSILIFAVLAVDRHRGPALQRVRPADLRDRQQRPGGALLRRLGGAHQDDRSSP